MLFRLDDSQVYLAGSVHFLPQPGHLPESLLAAHKAAEIVAFEWHLDGTGSAPSMQLPPPRRLSEFVPPKAMQQATDLAAALGISDDIDSLKPWAAALTLMRPLLASLGFVPGVDPRLWAATAQDKRVVLDSEHTLWSVNRSPVEEQVAGLVRLVADPSEGKGRVSRMVEGWRQGGEAAEAAFLAEMGIMRSIAPCLAHMLLEERNAAWLPKILEIKKLATPALIVVGALHLAGPSGLVADLRRLGVDVDPAEA